MRRFGFLAAVSTALVAPALGAQAADGPYNVLKRANVGGEGGWDYINADPVARRLYIPRGGPGRGSNDASYGPRIMVYNLDNLDSVGTVMGVQGNGAVADTKLGHGFASQRPGARILLMSGYTDDPVIRDGVREGEMQFLEKPFTSTALAEKVRKVLDA